MDTSPETAMMKVHLLRVGCQESAADYFTSKFPTYLEVFHLMEDVVVGQIPELPEEGPGPSLPIGVGVKDWCLFSFLYGFIRSYQGVLPSKCSFTAICPRSLEKSLDSVARPDVELMNFLAHLGYSEGEFQFLRIQYGLCSKEGLMELPHIDQALATYFADGVDDDVLPVDKQYLLAWCRGYLETEGDRYVFRNVRSLYHHTNIGRPFNLEVLEYSCFNEFAQKLGEYSDSDINRIGRAYNGFGFFNFCLADKNGRFYTVKGDFGHLGFHHMMNFPGRHKLQQALVWMSGARQAYGAPLKCSPEFECKQPNPYLKFTDFVTQCHTYERWCVENDLQGPDNYKQSQPRRVADRKKRKFA